MDRARWWDRKILGWEDGRYDLATHEGGLLERIADRSSDSLRFRLAHTAELLAPHVAGKVVVDVGCGSGLLARPLIEAGARAYRGIDLAPAAVTRGQERAEAWGLADKVTFTLGAAEDDTPFDADVVVSLGLTDWLDDDALDRLFARGGSAHFLHAYSELRARPDQWLHRAYCWTAYGWRNGGYVPRYFATDRLAARARSHRPGPVHVIRHPRLSFGALLSSLPLGEPVTP